jgi:hypothetical protein
MTYLVIWYWHRKRVGRLNSKGATTVSMITLRTMTVCLTMQNTALHITSVDA